MLAGGLFRSASVSDITSPVSASTHIELMSLLRGSVSGAGAFGAFFPVTEALRAGGFDRASTPAP